MGASDYPPYVSRHGHGEQVVLPPGDVQGAKNYVFVLDADPAQLDALVARNLSAPTGGEMEYRVVGSHVLLTFLDAKRLTSTAETVGYIPDRECAFWVLLAAKKRGWLEPERLVFWMPYVFVDTSIAMATGREVWGFTKEIGVLSVPQAPGDAMRFVTQATLFKTFDQQTRGTVEPLVQVYRDGSMGALPAIWKTGREAFDTVVDRLTGSHGTLPIYNWASDATLVVDLLKLLFTGEVPLVNLKQFRDAQDGTRACYQALIEGPCKLESLTNGGLLSGEFAVDITPCASHQIVEDLGLRVHSKIPVSIAFWIEMQFAVLPGKEVWRAG